MGDLQIQVAPPPSPFNSDGVQFAWDSTSLGWLKTCPRLYYYSMIRQLAPKGERIHLKFGLHYHDCLEYYDIQRSAGASHDSAMEAATAKALTDTAGWESSHHLKTRETLVRSIVWYLDQFGENDPARTYQLANGRPAVELSFRFEVDDGLMLSGHLDRVVEFNGDLYVMDRKTSSSTIASYFFEGFAPDNQMSLYSLAARTVFGVPVQGVIIDAAQIAVGFTRFERGFTHRTNAQLTEWLASTKIYTEMAYQFTEANFWPMNDKACHHYGGCAFRKVCNKDPAVRETFIASDFEEQSGTPSSRGNNAITSGSSIK